MFHITLPVDTQVTSELSPNHCYTTLHSQNDRMYHAPNKTKKMNKAFSYLFWHTLSDHHICHGVRPLGCHVKNGSFSLSRM